MLEKIISPTSASQSIDNSLAFLSSPVLRFEKVTCLLVELSILRITIFPLPISLALYSFEISRVSPPAELGLLDPWQNNGISSEWIRVDRGMNNRPENDLFFPREKTSKFGEKVERKIKQRKLLTLALMDEVCFFPQRGPWCNSCFIWKPESSFWTSGKKNWKQKNKKLSNQSSWKHGPLRALSGFLLRPLNHDPTTRGRCMGVAHSPSLIDICDGVSRGSFRTQRRSESEGARDTRRLPGEISGECIRASGWRLFLGVSEFLPWSRGGGNSIMFGASLWVPRGRRIPRALSLWRGFYFFGFRWDHQ